MTDTIGIPKGGGALSGIGETFQPDLHTGTAHLSIPLPLPPGRGGFVPTLALAYSSAAGNGPFGLGWSLDIPRIARRTDRGVPRYDDARDTFVLSGAEELAAVPLGTASPPDLPAGATATRYRPRTETLFARIVHVIGAGHDYWDIWSKDGLRSVYGTVRPPDAPQDWADPAAIHTPDGAVFTWLLSQTRDTFSSRIRYSYRGDAGTAQRYLDTVEYAEYGDLDDPAYAVTVRLGYDDQRGDPFTDRRPGFELRTRLRATHIAVTTVGSGESPVSTVDLAYADSDQSLLTSVRITGHEPATGDSQSLPPITFGYSAWNPSARSYRRLASTLPPLALGSGLELVDLFGDGLPSVLQLGRDARYWRNLDDGRFAPPRPLTDAPPATLGEPGTMITDLNGDGRPELVTSAAGVTVWPLATPTGAAGRAGFTTPYTARSSTATRLTDPETRLVDLDGDHILDLVASGPTPLAATGDGAGNWAEMRPLFDAPPPLTSLGDPRVRIADMTGDGLADIVLVHDRSVRYWPSLGHGRYGAPVDMASSPHFADAAAYSGTGFDPRRLLLGDITGDGSADAVYVADGSVTVWLNIAGNRFSAPTIIPGTPRTDARTDVRLADTDGTGVAGLLWSGLGADGKWAFLDFTGGVKPYLLTDIDNHRGASTHLVWSTSTAFATADRSTGNPWQTTLPFPVHVVAATETRDHFAGTVLTSQMRYHDGYWDPADREFRGFGCVEHADTLAAAQPQPPAPAQLNRLDPLTPASAIPDGFDPARNGNLLQNWSFDSPRPGPSPTSLTTTAAQPYGGGLAAADGWTTWNNTAATTTTELKPSSLAQGRGGSMIHVTTAGAGCGIVQVIAPQDTGPARVDASAWIYVVTGSVVIGTGNGGDIAADALLERTGEWVLVSAGNQRTPANEFIVYSANDGGCEFYVDHAWIRVADVPPDPLDTPPVRTTTWFHLGPVGPATGAWTDLNVQDRYWPADPPLLQHIDTSALPASLPRAALREALRAARGRVLRTETYCDDHSQLAARPYEVHDTAFEVVPVLDGRTADDASWQVAPVVTVRDTLTRSTEWDRGDDPMTRITATGGYDDYNRPTVTATIGVACGRDPRASSGSTCLATVTTTAYATRDDDRGYLLDRAAVVTRHEAVDAGTDTVLDFAQATLAGHRTGELRAAEATYYDGDAFTGLTLGDLGDHGLPTRFEHLILTPTRLADMCSPIIDGGTSTPVPPYLDTDQATPWPPDYPAAFTDSVDQAPAARGPHLGYTWHGDGDPLPNGWYAPTGQLRYDLHTPLPGRPPRGLVLVSRDAFGGDTTHDWDMYDLFLERTTDPVGLTTTAKNDYRFFKPVQVTDPNANQTLIGYTPLGLPAWIAKQGKDGERDGDTASQPGQRFDYDLDAWDASASGATRQPIRVTTVRRADHRWTIVNGEDEQHKAHGQPPLTDAEIEALFPATELDDHPERFICAAEFTDGSGRLLQTRTQADDLIVTDVGLPWDLTAAARTVTADPGPGQDRVIVSGRQTYDNKGRPVVAREPFFGTGYDYVPADSATLASLAAVRQHYDARGRNTVTVGTDGSQTRHVYGRPVDPADPSSASPTPWETWTYDPIDNAGRSHPTSTLPQAHLWNTAASIELDAFGRTIRTVQRGLDSDVVTTVEYDIDGQPTKVTDPLGRTASRTVYDHAGKAWTAWLLDAGTTRSFHDAAGGVAERRDDKGALQLFAYDAAHRHVLTWAADYATGQPTLREVLVYGDDTDATGLARDRAAAANLLGRVTVALDEAGRVTTSSYDLDGNPLSTTRHVLRADLLLAALPAPGSGPWINTAYAVDWQPATGQSVGARAAELLDGTAYETTMSFDALGRPTTSQAPMDVTGKRASITYEYGRGGGIATVAVDDQPFLRALAYDAHGRRSLAHLGNGTLIRYSYDTRTLRLRRLRAEHAAVTAGTWACDGPVLQDHTYRHDESGNLLTIGDRTPRCGIAPGDLDTLDLHFNYDPLNRLLDATGRETDTVPEQPWVDQPRSTDVTKARAYIESYTYDLVGNLQTLKHATDGSGAGAYTRGLPVVDGSNRLASLTVGKLTANYTYDDCGNMLAEATNRSFEWDHANRLATFRDQAGPKLPTVYAQYRYDSAGQRVLKIVRRSSGPDEITLYIGGFERVLRGTVGGALSAYDELHLVDNASHLASIRRGAALPGDGLADNPVRYQVADHLASVTATLAVSGSLLSREEYLPYGETSFGSYAHKRYRFTAKQRDDESGLSHHGVRYYAPWLARWGSCDPDGQLDSHTLYAYAGNRPMRFADPSGRAAVPRPQLISASEDLLAAFEKAAMKVTGASSFADAERMIRSEILRAVQNNGLGSNKKVGTGINVARQWYARVRTAAGKLVDLADIQLHHLEGGLAANPLEAVNPKKLLAVTRGAHVDIHRLDAALPDTQANMVKNSLKRFPSGFASVSGLTRTLQLFAVAGGVFDALALKDDISARNYVAIPGHVVGVLAGAAQGGSLMLAAAGARIASAALGTAAATLGSVALAGAAGWYAGTKIDQHLSEETKTNIGGTINAVVNEGGWKLAFSHPFGVGM
jgi:RHS repeat-associated protein